MEVRPVTDGGSHAVNSSSTAARAEVDALLQVGAYEELERLLAAERDTGGTDHVHILDAAVQLCLTCVELRREQDDHNEALQRVARLEEKTRLRLGLLLEALEERAPPVAENPPTPPGAAPNWWVTLWRRVTFALIPPRPEPPAAPRAPREMSIARPDKPDEMPVALPNAPDELFPTHGPVPVTDISAADLHVYTLGRFRVFHGQHVLDEWTGNKSRSLFKYLLIHREAPVHTDQLLDTFWRDSSPDMARRSLYQTIYLVRQALQAVGRPVIVQVNGGYRMNPELDVQVDSEAFMGHYRAGLEAAGRGDDVAMAAAFQAAEMLYEGEFMAEDPYEEWPVARREQLRNAYLDALDRLGRRFAAAREDGPCIVYCRKLLEIDACREDVHRRLMRVFARRGERSLALRQYHRCVEALREELDVEPLVETIRLYEQILENGLHF